MILLNVLLTKGSKTRLVSLRIISQMRFQWICMTNMQKTILSKMDLGEFQTLISKNSIIKDRFKFFLDGSRHVYKVGDVLIAGTVYPVVAGQIIVGCCIRENRELRKFKYERKLVIAMPKIYDADHHGPNFFRKKRDEINTAIEENSLICPKVKFDAIIPYKVDGDITILC